MNSLPLCRWREALPSGKAHCHSPKIMSPPDGFDPMLVCVNRDRTPCRYADHEPLTQEQIDARNAIREQAKAGAPLVPQSGPGTELKKMLLEIGFQPGNCYCESKAAQMNIWSIDLCRVHRLEIAGWLQEMAKKTITEFKVDDPVESFLPLVDEAIRRAASKPPS